MGERRIRHKGRLTQTFIYLGKLFRMFLFQNDWKVLPMSAVIAALVAFSVGKNLFVTMEGTLMGSFALACICVWNGFFNSIQMVCRERAIVKREHRSGLHISSYVAAHMIYQALLCVAQAVITINVISFMGVKLPEKGLIFDLPVVDFGITLFLITYCADMLALLISSFARTTTTAMTIMPFMLIVQLLFSGGFFSLPAEAMPFTNLTATKWGLTALCSQGDYNSLPMVSVWNNALKMKNLEVEGEKPLLEAFKLIEENNQRDELLMKSGELNQNPDYNFDPFILIECWGWLILWTIVYSVITVILLEFIDRDKR
ncbi:ABC-2 type transporter [Butyrivibrio fibrisolvens DSM 3071]|uniref:ABC-2 type transporter n=1 Tax=Butyrivibrio fibrisolvens DSM 3071 TaxID=1121131 RepID=A0A1M5ZME6_BUTFI|nr:ABC transporter permease [Butyrivibrio fibrisolvens]SHI25308.1 ABC-2 type transporter [Butyrivibrio fibrisolvens DSM 3071]